MLKNLKNKISFSYMTVSTLKVNLKRGMKWRLVIILTRNLISNGDKLSIHFEKSEIDLEKSTKGKSNS